MSLTDEQKAKLKEEFFPDVFETTGKGRPRFPIVYDPDPSSERGGRRFVLNQEAYGHLLDAIYSMKEGVSFRQVAEYLSTHAGRSVTYEACRLLFKRLCTVFPEWADYRAEAHGASRNNIQSKDYEDQDKRKEAQKKSQLKRKITNLKKEYETLENKNKPPEEDDGAPIIDGAEIIGGHNKKDNEDAPVIFKPNAGPTD